MVTADELIAHARRAARNAYAPYSSFPVGAALETADGRIITGCNVENASFGLTICAERNAITTMIATAGADTDDGHAPRPIITQIAIVGLKAAPCYPCGACRQVLNEFSCGSVIVESDDPAAPITIDFSDLLPHAFGPDSLQ